MTLRTLVSLSVCYLLTRAELSPFVLFKICFPIRLICFSCWVGYFFLVGFLLFLGVFLFWFCSFVGVYSGVFWFVCLFFLQVKSPNKDIQVLALDNIEVKMGTKILNLVLYLHKYSRAWLPYHGMRGTCRALKLSCLSQTRNL